MAEILLEFRTPVRGGDHSSYRAIACGGEAGDGTGRWHGWLEFIPVSGGTTIRTPRETTQRNRTDTAYWASGLTPMYLDGALHRALQAFPAVAPILTTSGSADGGGGRPPLRFSDVGGMDDLKAQVRRIVETIHLNHEDAQRYGIVRNGILLYGPPGCGKTFFAQAIAGEFGLRFQRVPLASAVSKYVGGGPEAIEGVFREALSSLPCLLFFDEFDAVACKRQRVQAIQEQQMIDALLQQLDVHRTVRGLLIVAATNRFDDLDPALIREGRFDYKVQIGRPDFDARREILRVQLYKRPRSPRIDTARLAHDLEGFSAAQIQNVVDEAALLALEAGTPITQRHLRAAYRTHVAAGRYGGPKLGWNDLVLPIETKQKLQLITRFIANPELTRDLNVAPPTGVLLYGPSGTGKTTIARVLASETSATFLSANAAEILSKWLGESERQMKELFERARERVPAIVFLDEIDALAGRRNESISAADHARNAVVNTLLVEMDGLDASARVFVIGATNRPELLDEALLRPGRLGEAIEIGLPAAGEREALLELFTHKVRLDRSVNLKRVAARTEGASGADLKGLCTLAGRNAFVRALDAPKRTPTVTSDDFERALETARAGGVWARDGRSIGFRPRAL